MPKPLSVILSSAFEDARQQNDMDLLYIHLYISNVFGNAHGIAAIFWLLIQPQQNKT